MENAETDLFKAVLAGNVERVRSLLAGGLSPNVFDLSGQTPLTLAIDIGPNDDQSPNTLVEVLLAAGARHDLRSFDDRTALMHAASSGNLQACEALLAAGADPDLRNFKGRTALMLAANALHPGVMAKLIECGAQHSLTDTDGFSAIDIVGLKQRDPERAKRCAKILQKAGVRWRWNVGSWFKDSPPVRFLKRLLRHFTEDERTQLNHAPINNTKFLIFALLLLLLQSTLYQSGLALLVLAGAAALLLFAFPSILQLPYLFLMHLLKPAGGAPVSSDPMAEADEERGNELDPIRNFLRLGWSAQAEMIRAKAREIAIPHTRDHLASIGLAVGVAILSFGYPALNGGFMFLLRASALMLALGLEKNRRVRRLRTRQASWDHLAAEVNRHLADAADGPQDENGNFILYLRTFGVTGKLKISGLDFESSICYNLSPMIPVVALGHPGEAIGAGRILTADEHWQEDILRLVERSSKIMLIPSHRDGTKWEITRLKEGHYFEKTIIVMPPDVPFGEENYSMEWNRATAELAPLGLHLPPHYPQGLLFKLGPDGRIAEHAPLLTARFLAELGDIAELLGSGVDDGSWHDQSGPDGHHGGGGHGQHNAGGHHNSSGHHNAGGHHEAGRHHEAAGHHNDGGHHEAPVDFGGGHH